MNRKNFLNCFSLRWSKWGAWKKLFVILAVLFLLFWLSAASLFALPVITFAYFFTMVIKNIMDIHANWKWGNILPIGRRSRDMTEKEILEGDQHLVAGKDMLLEEDVLMKFPPVDPRVSKSRRKKKDTLAKDAEVNVTGVESSDDKDKKDTVIRHIESHKVVDDTEKVEADKEEKKGSES